MVIHKAFYVRGDIDYELKKKKKKESDTPGLMFVYMHQYLDSENT